MAARIVVFHQRGFERLVGLLDEARHLEVGRDDALGRELLQGLEPPSAGGDGVKAGRIGGRMNDEILVKTAGANAALSSMNPFPLSSSGAVRICFGEVTATCLRQPYSSAGCRR
jgi:hypothetical protein